MGLSALIVSAVIVSAAIVGYLSNTLNTNEFSVVTPFLLTGNNYLTIPNNTCGGYINLTGTIKQVSTNGVLNFVPDIYGEYSTNGGSVWMPYNFSLGGVTVKYKYNSYPLTTMTMTNRSFNVKGGTHLCPLAATPYSLNYSFSISPYLQPALYRFHSTVRSDTYTWKWT